jgi:bla regulator protein blaR1
MKSILFYLLQVIITSGVLYGYYHLFLREKKFHQYNRFYLLSAIVMSILIPFVSIPIYYNQEVNHSSIIYQTLLVISTHDTESFPLSTNNAVSHLTVLTWQNLIITSYTLIACFILTKFFIALNKIKHLLKTYPGKKLENIHFIETAEPGTPFSFFKWLFWNNKIRLNSKEGEQIFRHELFHIQQKHSWDIVFMELITILFWINPFVHLIKKEIKAIHEFLADEFAMKNSQNWNYAELLLMQALGTQNNRLTNPFFHNQIKRRISMITSAKHPSYQYLRKVMVIPIAAILFGLLAFKIQSRVNKVTGVKTQIPITVVIDPGHGGKDRGVSLNGINEKDICLAIAKKIKALNKDENIQLLFTRMDDSATSPKEDADFADKNNADILISLHVNAADQPWTDASKKGIEVYVSSRKKEDYKSGVLANALINELQNTHDINRYVLKKETGVWILDAPRCAAALIEFGYITNPGDFSFISNEANQEKVAINILTAIQKYAVVRAEGIIEENEPLKFETEKQTGKNIITYHGKEIKEISPYGSKGQLVFVFDSSQQLLSKEKSELILKLYWNEIKPIYIPVYDTKKYGGNGKPNDSEKTRENEVNKWDTIPKNSKIKAEDINEISVRGGHIVIKLKNGDSILAVQNDYLQRERENQMKMEHLQQLKQSKEKEYELMQMMKEKQRETQLENEEFERMMMAKQIETKMREEELQKLLSMKQNGVPPEKQEELKKMLEMKKREFEQHQIEFKNMIDDRQHQAQMQNEEFRKILEAKKQQLILQEENRKNMELNRENNQNENKEQSKKKKNKN